MRVIVAGTGQLSVIEIIESCEGMKLAGFIDDNKENYSRDLHGYSILGGFEWIKSNSGFYIINSIARTTSLRKKTTKKLIDHGAKFTNLVHPTVSLKGVKMGHGNIIGKNVILESGVELGNHNMILANSVLGHDSKVGDYNFFGINTILQGFVKVENMVFFGARSLVEPNIHIESNALVMAGSNVFSDVPQEYMVVNRPSPMIAIPKNSQHCQSKFA